MMIAIYCNVYRDRWRLGKHSFNSGRFLQTPGLLQPGGVQSPAPGEAWKSHGSTEARRGLARGITWIRTSPLWFDAEKFQYMFNCSASIFSAHWTGTNCWLFLKSKTSLHSTPQHRRSFGTENCDITRRRSSPTKRCALRRPGVTGVARCSSWSNWSDSTCWLLWRLLPAFLLLK